MEPVLQQGETQTYWVVCEEHSDGRWFQRNYPQMTQELGYKKLRHLRRWHPNAFLATIVITQCDGENPEPSLPAPSSNPGPTCRPHLRLV